MDDPIKPGEIVNVTILGVRAVHHPSQRLARIVDGDGNPFDMPPQAKLDRVAPALWPPCRGDLWRDGRQRLWLACEFEEGEVRMVCASNGETRPPEYLLKTGSVYIVHHENDRPPF